MTLLEIKHLKMLRMIDETNNLTQAAKKLFISQPALSQQLKDIEMKLGTPLFLRTKKNMIMTRVGKKLLNHAKVILEEIEKAELEVEKAVNGEKGDLRIGVRCLFCYTWIPKVIKQFQDKYPNVDLTIGNSMDPEKDLMLKNCDVVISTAPFENRDIGFIPLFEDEFLCVMSKDHSLSHRKFLEIEDFDGADMISMVEKTGPSFYKYFFENKGVRLRRYMTITHPEAVVELVEANLGIALLPKWFIAPYVASKNIHTCRLTSKKTILQWRAGFMKEKSMPPYQREFINIITSNPITYHG